MATKINPLSFTGVSYELYKQKARWEVTDRRKDKQGVVIALSLPEDDKNRIQEKVFSQIGHEDLKKENGLDILIDFLNSQMMKDELSDSLEKF